MKRGFTLLEVVVVIAIIAILSLFGVNTINNFRRNASLDNAASELLSEIRVARNKSMTGEVMEGEKEEDFNPNGLPEYGVNILADRYELIRRCVKLAGNCDTEPAIEMIMLDDQFTLDPIGKFYFDRIAGNPDISGTKTINILEKKGSKKWGRKIEITKDFEVNIYSI